MQFGQKEQALVALNTALSIAQKTDTLRHKSDVVLKTGSEIMARAGEADLARDLMGRIEDKKYRSEPMRTLARAEAEAGRFVKAFEALSESSTEPLQFLIDLGTWIHLIDKRRPGIVPDLIREATDVFGWLREDVRSLFVEDID